MSSGGGFLAHAFNAGNVLRVGFHHGRQQAEAAHQLVCDGIHVDTRNDVENEQLKNLVILEPIQAIL